MYLFPKKKKKKKKIITILVRTIVKTRQKERNERNHANSRTFEGIILDSH